MGRTSEKLTRLDLQGELREKILPLCRLKKGEIWDDPVIGHRVGVLDASNSAAVYELMNGEKIGLALNDPPYNVMVGNEHKFVCFEKFIRRSQLTMIHIIFYLRFYCHFN